METLDFHVEIGTGSGDDRDPGRPRTYEVTLRGSDGDEASEVSQVSEVKPFPLTPGELRALDTTVPHAVLVSAARPRRAVGEGERPVRELGRRLYEFLLGGKGRPLFTAARHRAARDDRHLRIVLRVRASELARLPWEFLFDADEDSYVCQTTSLVRRPEVSAPERPLTVRPPLRVLCMAARPEDQEPLAVAAEQEWLNRALSDLRRQGLIHVEWTEGPSWRDLRTALHRGPWHALHFIGHGGFDPVGAEGTLALADDSGGTYHLGADDLAMVLARHTSLRLVVLNACETGRPAERDPFSSMAGALMRRGLPAAVAMQYPISDDAAIEFSRTFYDLLARRHPVDEAVTEARQNIRLARRGTLEWVTPVLFMRSLDGHLFDLTGSGTAVADPGEVHDPAREVPVTVGEVRPDESPDAMHQVRPDEVPAPANEAPVTPVEAPPQSVEAPATPSTPVTLISEWAPPVVRDKSAATTSRSSNVRPADDVPIRLPGRPLHFAFSPDGARFVIACLGRKVLVGDVADPGRSHLIRHDRTLERLGKLAREDRMPIAAALAPGGRQLVTYAAPTLRTWDVDSRTQIAEWRTDEPDGRVALGGDGLNALFLPGSSGAYHWRVWTDVPRRLTGQERDVSLAVTSRDGTLFATLDARADLGRAWVLAAQGIHTRTRELHVRVWDAVTGRMLAERNCGTDVLHVVLHPHNTGFATGHGDGKARVWGSEGEGVVVADRGSTFFLDVAYDRDGTRLAVAKEDSVSVEDVRTDRVVSSRQYRTGWKVHALCFGPDERARALVERDHEVWLTSIDTMAQGIRYPWDDEGPTDAELRGDTP